VQGKYSLNFEPPHSSYSQTWHIFARRLTFAPKSKLEWCTGWHNGPFSVVGPPWDFSGVRRSTPRSRKSWSSITSNSNPPPPSSSLSYYGWNTLTSLSVLPNCSSQSNVFLSLLDQEIGNHCIKTTTAPSFNSGVAKK
jgi:hypothetical protein